MPFDSPLFRSFKFFLFSTFVSWYLVATPVLTTPQLVSSASHNELFATLYNEGRLRLIEKLHTLYISSLKSRATKKRLTDDTCKHLKALDFIFENSEAQSLYLQAIDKINVGDSDTSQKLLLRAESKNPRHPLIILALAERKIKDEKNKEALQILKTALSIYPFHKEIYRKYMLLLFLENELNLLVETEKNHRSLCVHDDDGLDEDLAFFSHIENTSLLRAPPITKRLFEMTPQNELIQAILPYEQGLYLLNQKKYKIAQHYFLKFQENSSNRLLRPTPLYEEIIKSRLILTKKHMP